MAENLVIPDQIVYETLNGAGNHESKIALSGLVLDNSHRALPDREWADLLCETEGDQSHALRPSDVRSFFEHSLDPIAGLVTFSRKDGWQARHEYREEKQALLRFLGKWSLRWPYISLQQVYGSSKSSTDRRSPQTRHKIYGALHAEDRSFGTMTVAEIAADMEDPNYGRVEAHVNALTDLELLVKDSSRKANVPIRIVDTEYRGRRTSLEKTIPETRSLYAAMKQLGEGAETSVNALVSLAREIDPTIDTSKLRTQLLHALQRGKGYPGIQLASTIYPEKTSVTVDPTAAESISELVRGIHGLQRGEVIRGYKLAVKTAMDPDVRQELLSKGYIFSPNAQRINPEVTKRRISGLVGAGQALTGFDIRRQLIRHHETAFSQKHINSLLSSLIKAGVLTYDSYYDEPHSKVSRRVYRLA